MKMKYAEGGEVDNQRNKEIAQDILQQLGGGNRLIRMVGAYNFVIIPNGVAFRIKNAKANVIKITLNGLDLYNLEVGRVRGTTYKVVLKEENLYNDMLKPIIEKATGMYLSLYEKGGNIETEVDALYKKSQLINADENWKFKLLELLQVGSSEAYDMYQRLNAKQKAEVLQEQFEMDNAMGSDGDGKKSTSKENLMALLDDAKNGKKYEKGGAMKNKMAEKVGEKKYFIVSAKDGKVVSKGFDTEEKAKAEMYKMFEKTKDFSYAIKKMAKGGKTTTRNVQRELLQLRADGVKYVQLNGFKESIGYVIDLNLDDDEINKVGEKSYDTTYKKGGKMAKGGNIYKDLSIEEGERLLDLYKVDDDTFEVWIDDQGYKIIRPRTTDWGLYKKGNVTKSWLELLNEYVKSKKMLKSNKMAKGGGVGSSDTPKIYVADLHAYNNGRLIGEWLDLGEYENGEEVMEAIQQIVDKWKAKYGEEHEEFAIHDYENFSEDLYSEYMSEKSFDQVVKIYKISQEKGIPQEVLGSIAREYDVEGDDLEEWIDEHYEGQFDSDTDLAYNYVDMVGGVNELDKKTLENYFDYESFGRDLAYDYREFDGYYFRSYKRGGNIGKKYDLMKYLKMDSSGWNYSIGGL